MLLLGFDFWEGGGGAPPSLPAEVAISGNGVPIADGNSVVSDVDHTDFGVVYDGGASRTRTFTVFNTGDEVLTRTAPTTVPTGFTLVTDITATIAGGASAPLVIRGNASTVGTKTGNVTVNTDDVDEGVYTFAVKLVVATAPVGGDDDGGGLIRSVIV